MPTFAELIAPARQSLELQRSGHFGNTNAKREGPSRTDRTPREAKTCIGCHVTLPRSSFYAQPLGIYGLSPRCKDCVREQTRERERDDLRRGALNVFTEFGIERDGDVWFRQECGRLESEF